MSFDTEYPKAIASLKKATKSQETHNKAGPDASKALRELKNELRTNKKLYEQLAVVKKQYDGN
jgi:hypothetical protein